MQMLHSTVHQNLVWSQTYLKTNGLIEKTKPSPVFNVFIWKLSFTFQCIYLLRANMTIT